VEQEKLHTVQPVEKSSSPKRKPERKKRGKESGNCVRRMNLKKKKNIENL